MRLQLKPRLSRGLGLVLLAQLCAGRSGAEPAAAESTTTPAPTAIAARVSVELSGYTDSDAVHVASPTIGATVSDELAGWSVSGRYLVDAVSAASVDVVATASPPWFEYRHVGSGAIEYKRGEVGLGLSGGVSSEPDYLSRNVGLGVTVETLDKNLTPTVMLSYGWDAAGRTGLDRAHWEAMERLGAQAGATFVVDRATIASVSFDAIYERGYLAKPYRYVPLFAPGTSGSIPPGAAPGVVNDRRLDLRPADALPRARDRYALSLRLAHRLDGASLRLFERIYRDDWGLTGSTTDARLMVDVGRHWLIWPHLRLHGQRAVGFWQRAYEAVPAPDGSLGVPAFRTGDRELGSLVTATAGGGVRIYLGDGADAPWSIALQADAIFTRYFDALYVSDRRALFGALTLDARFD